MSEARNRFKKIMFALADEAVAFAQELVRIDSSNPPGDTRAMAECCRARLAACSVEAQIVSGKEPVANVIARIKGGRQGPRLAFNGHLDTGAVPEPDRWTVPPFGGLIREGRLYGKGVADMKAGVAAMTMACVALARVSAELSGEAILCLVGDEGSGATWGTRYLLDEFPETAGDALLSADVGSTGVARFGEKGYQWIELTAKGRSAGGAHPHLGVNAADLLMEAVRRIQFLCSSWRANVPEDVRASILAAAARSEALAGAGETTSMLGVTANLGMISAGTRPNLVPASGRAVLDIRFPPGISCRDVIKRCGAAVADLPGVHCTALDGADPNWTSPDADIVKALMNCSEEISGSRPALSLRLGFSDARIYRERKTPAVVLGVTPFNANAPDEYAEVNEIRRLFAIHALTAFDFLSGSPVKDQAARRLSTAASARDF